MARDHPTRPISPACCQIRATALPANSVDDDGRREHEIDRKPRSIAPELTMAARQPDKIHEGIKVPMKETGCKRDGQRTDRSAG